MKSESIRKIVYSSSAAVYGNVKQSPVPENAITQPTSPYGFTKLIGEQILEFYSSKKDLDYISLRYFNVIGCADPKLGDTSRENLLPKIFRKLSLGQEPDIYGNDYDTPDGTCIRDYIDVRDLSAAHILAAESLLQNKNNLVLNVGTSKGYSVKQIMEATKDVTGREFNYKNQPRRSGDPAQLVADSDLIRSTFAWRNNFTLRDSIESAWQSYL